MKAMVQCKKLVKPSSPTPTHLQKLNLSLADQLQIPFYVGLIFHYQTVGDVSESSTIDCRLGNLESSLSETLTLFYHVAGRFNGADCSIECNDQGVGYVEARVDAELGEFLDRREPDLDLLVGLPEFLEQSPLAVIQVNVFKCGGIVIGTQFNHMMGDMFTMATFMNAWSTACRRGIQEVARPTIGLASLIPLLKIPDMPSPPAPNGVKLVSKRFVFNHHAISRLRIAADHDGKKHHSRVTLVTALLSKVFIKMESAKHQQPRPCLMVHVMNMRERTKVPVNKDLCGNFFTLVMAELPSRQADPNLCSLADSVSGAIKGGASELAKVEDGNVLASMFMNSVREFFHQWGRGEMEVRKFSSWCGFPLYEVDFGWGRPSLVSTLTVPLDLMVLMDDKSGDGVAVTACLSEDDMVLFEQDPELHAYAS